MVTTITYLDDSQPQTELGPQLPHTLDEPAHHTILHFGLSAGKIKMTTIETRTWRMIFFLKNMAGVMPIH
jgi:hypothetical protein